MVETIESLHKKRLKTGVEASNLRTEHTTAMRKTLASMKNVKTKEPLRIGLDDLRNADKRGKWWLVGASYRDDTRPTKIKQVEAETKEQALVAEAEDPNSPANLIQLAKNQGMNTDIRRAIFVTLLSACDYKDAYNRLLKLRLRKSQAAEIPKVIIRCVSSENLYNPYYALISRELCKDIKYKKDFQFLIRVLLMRMEEQTMDNKEDDEGNMPLEVKEIIHLAKMYGNLVAEGSLNLLILKVCLSLSTILELTDLET
jgi:nucleolar MIF4G domain-containing protein 1